MKISNFYSNWLFQILLKLYILIILTEMLVITSFLYGWKENVSVSNYHNACCVIRRSTLSSISLQSAINATTTHQVSTPTQASRSVKSRPQILPTPPLKTLKTKQQISQTGPIKANHHINKSTLKSPETEQNVKPSVIGREIRPISTSTPSHSHRRSAKSKVYSDMVDIMDSPVEHTTIRTGTVTPVLKADIASTSSDELTSFTPSPPSSAKTSKQAARFRSMVISCRDGKWSLYVSM